MFKNIDIEAILFLYILKMREDKQKEYTVEECNYNIAYVFNNEEEYKDYFINNGYENIDERVLELCKMKTTKKGSIIAMKKLCDHVITNSKDVKKKSKRLIKK